MHMLVWHVLWPLNLSLRVLESSSRGLDGKFSYIRKMIIAIYTIIVSLHFRTKSGHDDK